MVRPTSPRTAILLRAYCGLLAVSVALGGVLTARHVATAQTAPHEVVAPRDAQAPHGPAPMINWGGQKR
jgi:hypothetical protein